MKGKITLRSLVGIVLLGSLGIVGFYFWQALAPAPADKNPPAKPDGAVDLKLDRVHYTETREGVKEWELEAVSAAYYKEQNTVVLEKVRVTFYGKNQESYVLVGERGKLNTQTKIIEVFGGVKVDSSDGYQMVTQSLKYQANLKELSTPDPVDMRGPDLRVQGVGMIVDLNHQRVKILGEVTTILSSLERQKPSRFTM
jgi:LPS export ABC transporter protein LptC